ncbi:MAG: CopG family transcriptional regulator [Spirochaetaceae bacterium]|nr:MAG: CopG family transcriptional regulator [Spirochaetaceae bacterium]
MKNLQIALDDESVRTLDELARELHKTRTALVREAIQEWIDRKQVQEFEAAWIRAAQQDQPDEDLAQAWIAAESWESS